ncbi:MAG: RNA polymerase sigma factor [Solirubrobacterales bacterium]
MTPPPFQWFLDEHRDDVYRFLVAAVGPQEADDCFQETFLSAMRAYPRLRANSNTRAWVLTIAHRKALDSHRARGRRPLPLAEPPEPRPSDGPAHADAELWSEVRKLPGKQRAAIALRYAGDLSHGEIGRVLGCSEEAARRNVHEGLKKLRLTWQT